MRRDYGLCVAGKAGESESQALVSGSSDGNIIVWLLDLKNAEQPWIIAAVLKVPPLPPLSAPPQFHSTHIGERFICMQRQIVL